MTKRSAACECRCAGATSPPLMAWIAQVSVWVAPCLSVGLLSTSTRRCASAAVMSFGGFEDVGPHVALIVPVHRRDLRRRLPHHDPVGDGPERRDVLLGHPRGERLLGLVLCCRHRVLPDCDGGPRLEQRSRLCSAAADIIMEIMERVEGIEPSSSAWKAVALPLSYTRGSPFLAAPPRARQMAGLPSRSAAGREGWWER